MSGGRARARDRQTNTYSVDILGRAFNVCSLCDPRHKKKQTNKRTRIDQIQSTFDHFRLCTPISGTERGLPVMCMRGCRDQKRSLFREYVHNSIDMFT